MSSDNQCAKCKDIDWIKSEIHLKPIIIDSSNNHSQQSNTAVNTGTCHEAGTLRGSDNQCYANDKFILDACCGVKYMWKNKNHPNTIYNDIRTEEKGFIPFNNTKNLSVRPDTNYDFRDLKFKNKSFKLVVFEPPHLKSLGENSKFRKIYGCLNKETWKDDIRKGK